MTINSLFQFKINLLYLNCIKLKKNLLDCIVFLNKRSINLSVFKNKECTTTPNLLNVLFALILSSLFSCSASNDQVNSPRPVYTNPYQQQQQYQPQGLPQDGYYYSPKSPYQSSPYQYQQPASRYYSNPYAMPPQNQYPYYDGDQYYVPPTSYGIRNQDNSPNSSASQKF